jgi:hypothetical protein
VFKAATRLAGRTVLFAAYAAGFLLLTIGFVLAFFVAVTRLMIEFCLAGEDEYEADVIAVNHFSVAINGFEQAARAMAFSPVVTARGRTWKF